MFSSQWRKETCQAFVKLQHSIACLSFGRCKAPDDFSKEVLARMQSRRLRQFRNVLTLLKWYFGICTAVHVAYLRTDSLPQDLVVMMAYAIALLADGCPQLVVTWNIGLWYSCLMLVLDLYIIPPWCSFDVMDATAVFLRLPIVLLNVGYQRLPVAAFWIMVRLSCMFWTVLANMPSTPVGMGKLQYELIFVSTVVLFTGMLSAHMEVDCRREVGDQAKDEKQAAVMALLGMTYDVVVELDSDFCVTKPSLVLSSFLLRPSLTALHRVPFEDLLFDDSDRALFRTRVCAALSMASSKEVVNLQMRDGNGAAVPVEMFSFRFHELGWHERCFLGVREFGDSMHRPCREAQGEQLVMEAGQSCGFEEEVVAVVNAMDQQLPILDSSPAFSLKVMPVATGSCFAPALVNADSFVDWLQETANKQWNADEDDGDMEGGDCPPELFDVEFRRGRTHVQAVCSAAMCKDALPRSGAECPQDVRMRLTFSHLMRRPSSSQGSASGSRSSSSRSSGGHRSQRRGTPMASVRHSLWGPPSGATR